MCTDSVPPCHPGLYIKQHPSLLVPKSRMALPPQYYNNYWHLNMQEKMVK